MGPLKGPCRPNLTTQRPPLRVQRGILPHYTKSALKVKDSSQAPGVSSTSVQHGCRLHAIAHCMHRAVHPEWHHSHASPPHSDSGLTSPETCEAMHRPAQRSSPDQRAGLQNDRSSGTTGHCLNRHKSSVAHVHVRSAHMFVLSPCITITRMN